LWQSRGLPLKQVAELQAVGDCCWLLAGGGALLLVLLSAVSFWPPVPSAVCFNGNAPQSLLLHLTADAAATFAS